MAITRAAVDAQMEAAVVDLAAGNPTAALNHAIAAQGLLSCLPDSRKGDEEVTWPLGRIDAFILNLRKQQTAAAAATAGHSVRTTKITYARTSAT